MATFAAEMNHSMSLKLLVAVLGLIVTSNGLAGITWTYAPNDTTINCGESEHFTNTGQPSVATDCAMGGLSITMNDVKFQAGACLKDSVIMRTWDVTDVCGNVNSYTQTITIVDTLAPVVICPSAQVLMALDGVDEIIPDYSLIASIDDPCTDYADLIIVQTPVAGTNLPLGSYTINISVTDLCGYTSDCDFTLHVYDTSGLYMTGFPSDTLVDCEHPLTPILLGTGSAYSTCPVATVSYSKVDVFVPGPCDGADTIVRNWTASDDCGNFALYTQIITTYDDEEPFILCMISDTFCNSTNGINAFLGDYTNTTAEIDNCSPVVIITQKPIPGAVEPIGVKEVWLYATDDCGNVDSCSMTVVVGDTSALALPTVTMTQMAIFPNPTDGEFAVVLPNVPGLITLRILDVLGREIKHLEGLKGDEAWVFDLKDQSGVYLVEVSGGGLRQVARLVVN